MEPMSQKILASLKTVKGWLAEVNLWETRATVLQPLYVLFGSSSIVLVFCVGLCAATWVLCFVASLMAVSAAAFLLSYFILFTSNRDALRSEWFGLAKEILRQQNPEHSRDDTGGENRPLR